MSRLAFVLVGWFATAALAQAQVREERFAIFSNGEKVGHVLASIDGSNVKIDYVIDDNGRGPKIRETLRLGADGLPVAWQIEGKAYFGAPVREQFALSGKRASWKTLNDSGSETLTETKPYVANDASPWIYGPMVRALLADADRTMPALPGGTLRAEKLKEVTIGSGEGARTLGAYALWGINYKPELILLDSDGRQFARIDAGFVALREGREADYEALSDLAQALRREQLEALTREHVHRFETPVYLSNVRVFDAEAGTLGEPKTVVVFRDRIGSIRADAKPVDGAVVIDGQGGTVLPGLTDVHAHLGDWAAPQHVAAGVTTVRDPGNDNEVLLELVSQIESGGILGPRVIRHGFIEGRTPFSARGGFVVDRLPLALEKVRWYADHGYQGIKIYNSVTPDWVAPIAAEAHRLGLTVMGHVPAFMNVERAVRDGYDEITHINQLMLSLVIDTDKEDTRTPFRFTALGERVGKLDLASEPVRRLVALMKERGTAIDPTVATFGPLLLGRRGEAAPTDVAWLAHMPAAVQRGRKTPMLDMKPGDDARYRASWERMLGMIRLLHEEGIRIVPGTDDYPGVVLHSELEAYVAAGIPNADVLRIATLGAAQHLGIDQDVGSIAPGKRADLLLVDGNPLEDMGAIRRIRMVMRNGDVIYPEDLYAAVGIEPFAKKPPVKLPRDLAAAAR